MNPDQFKQFMETMALQQQTLLNTIATIVNGKEKIPENVSTTSNLIPFENFDSKKEKFSCYLERFGNYCSMKNVSDKEKQAQLLCVSIGSFHYNKLASFLGPEKPVNKLSHDDLIKSFKQMLMPARSVVVSQHYFLNIYQKENQSISEFVADLQRDLVDCEFVTKCDCDKTLSIADIFLRAQFIRGLKDNWLRENILQSNLSSFDDILTKSIALEASKIESKQLTESKTPSNQSFASHNDINKVSSSSSNFSRGCSKSTQGTKIFNKHRNRSSSQNSRINFKALGIENLCIRCGKSNHKVRDCRTDSKKLSCNLCKKSGHVAKVCIASLLSSSKVKQNTHSFEDDSNSDQSNSNDYGIHKVDSGTKNCKVVDLFEVTSEIDKYLVNVKLNGKLQKFEVDSGAKYSLLAEDEFERLNLNLSLQETNLLFKSYSGNIIKPKGKVIVNVEYNGNSIQGELHVVPRGFDALLGRQWIRHLNIELKYVYEQMKASSSVSTVQSSKPPDDLYATFSHVFEEKVGCVPDIKISLQLREGAKPTFTRERKVPHALQELVDKEIDELESSGILTPVNCSDWGSPLVVIPKPNGSVRLCVDYKCGVNERLVQANYPIRRIDDVLSSLRNSRYFCKLDLFKAYLHLQVDEESSKIQTISTHRGTYRMNRLSFGIKTAPSEFNRILSQILNGVPKTEAYFDDIIVHGCTLEECTSNLQHCLQRLSDYNLHVNKQKCSFFSESIEYLGHIIEFNKIRKSPTKTEAVQKMPRPTNPDEVRRFLGLVTYYARFIPDFSTMTYPLRCLLRKEVRWLWTSKCENAFLQLKTELCSDRVLIPFDPSLPLNLTTDASPTGVAAILSHNVEGNERPIAYASRSLTQAEMNYSQLDREALAILFGVSHFYYYLFGKHFYLITDNQPLSRILHQNKVLPQMTSARLLRYAAFLSSFNYSVKFKKGDENKNVDCLSRSSIKELQTSTDQIIGNEVNEIYHEKIFHISSEEITFLTIKAETEKDQELTKIVKLLQNKREDSEFTLINGIIFRGERVYIPSSLRSKILAEIHDTHLGMTKMKQLSRRYVYWPGIDNDIDRVVRSCEQCALTKSSPPKQVHFWDTPENNWERVHIDYAGPVDNNYFLICVDAKSKWAEVRISKVTPDSSKTIDLLEDIFAFHGYPKQMVSDNATIFKSVEFLNYCKNSGIFQKFIAPGHPATNGLAERNVQTLKHKLQATSNEQIPIQEKLRKILFRYRATPLACEKSPAELYLKRKLRIRLNAIFPNKSKPSSYDSKPTRSLNVKERVQVRFFKNNKYVWEFGEVSKKIGKLHYLILLDNGRVIKRHINQLYMTLVNKTPQKSVTFGPTQIFDIPRIPRPRNDNPVQDAPLPEPHPATPDPVVVPPQELEPIPRKSHRVRRQPVKYKDYEM